MPNDFERMIDEIKQTLPKIRKYAAHSEWPNKTIKELGIAKSLRESLEAKGENVYNRIRPNPYKNVAPDCIASNPDGVNVGIEVRELVSQKAIEANPKGLSVYYEWREDDVLAEIQKIITEKDMKTYIGGPYAEIILLIHTDEPTIDRVQYIPLVNNHVFERTRQLTKGFILFSYDPDQKIRPFARIRFK